MQNLTVTEYKNIRVLTTQQIAEAYGTDTQVITNNFNRNKERYIEGKHFICLIGDEKAEFINKNQNEFSSFVRAKAIYLWTEKGAFLHAKSLNTDVAWEVYDRLVDSYFVKTKNSNFDTDKLSPELQMFGKLYEVVAKQEVEQKRQADKMEQLGNKIDSIKEVVALTMLST